MVCAVLALIVWLFSSALRLSSPRTSVETRKVVKPKTRMIRNENSKICFNAIGNLIF